MANNGEFLHPACRFEPQPSPTVCLDSGCAYQDVFSEASVYMLSCFDVTSAVLIAQVPPRHKRNALLLRVLLQVVFYVSETNPLIIYLKDVEKLLSQKDS
ncbi:unnamed protein product, partial [Brassica oleracea var. botrytis]